MDSAVTKFASTPSLSSIENTYRMGQVLQRQKRMHEAIQKFQAVCTQTERAIQLNPDATVDVQWVVLSLGSISDIYEGEKDYPKSRVFREAQIAFLEKMKEIKDMENGNDDDENDERRFYRVASSAQAYLSLFDKVHSAIDMPDTPPPEDPHELLRRLQEARKKDEEEQIERTIKLLNESADAREAELKKSKTKRFMRFVSEHPISFVVIVLIIAVAAITLVHLRPRIRSSQRKGDIDQQLANLEKIVRDFEQQHPDQALRAKRMAKNRKHLHEDL